jgi:hypothetical protein
MDSKSRRTFLGSLIAADRRFKASSCAVNSNQGRSLVTIFARLA